MIFSELYSDGDNFADEGYAARFKVLLHAIHHNLPVKAEMLNRNGKTVYTKFIPKKMEYSEKDDKFRVITSGWQYIGVWKRSKGNNRLYFYAALG